MTSETEELIWIGQKAYAKVIVIIKVVVYVGEYRLIVEFNSATVKCCLSFEFRFAFSACAAIQRSRSPCIQAVTSHWLFLCDKRMSRSGRILECFVLWCKRAVGPSSRTCTVTGPTSLRLLWGKVTMLVALACDERRRLNRTSLGDCRRALAIKTRLSCYFKFSSWCKRNLEEC